MVDALFIRGPHKLWPMVNDQDNFLPPQNLLALAATCEEAGFNVKIIDSCINKWGWKTTRKAIERLNPSLIGAGGPIIWTNEIIELFRIAKDINKDMVTVIGGPHASATPEDMFFEGSPVDFVVIGEGDITIVELLKEVLKPKERQDFKSIRGIAFKKGDKVILTKPRPLIQDLDTLPLPAYHLLPMERYERKNALWKNGSSIYHSRGCTMNCNFCSCWPLMGERYDDNDPHKVRPRWRTKSVKKTIEEMQILTEKYKKTFYMFVDDTWNVDPKWSEEFCRMKKEYGLDGKWFAFMRADYIVRDWKLGVMQKLAESGLAHVIIGVETSYKQNLKNLRKKNYTPTKSQLAVEIIRQISPKTFMHGTFINGLWEDDIEKIVNNAKWAKRIGVDYPSFHVLTPFPGTDIWKQLVAEGKLDKNINWDYYDFFTPLVPTKYLDRAGLAKANQKANLVFTMDPYWFFSGLFSRSKVKRWNYWWFTRQIIKMTINTILLNKNPLKSDPIAKNTGYLRLVEPKWYWD